MKEKQQWLRIRNPLINYNKTIRGVAQFGSAGALGALGRRFESCRPDWILKGFINPLLKFCYEKSKEEC